MTFTVITLADEPDERQRVIDILHCDRFCDDTPYEVFATLLDEGHYHCSIRTMYRLLEKEHGRQGASAACATAQLCQAGTAGHRAEPGVVMGYHQAQGAGQMDLLLPLCDHGHLQPLRGRLDGRPGESGALAKRLIEDTCEKQDIEPDQLIIHSDRGPSMTSKPVALLLSDLGVTKSHSRPHVSNDNPYSEAQFKTLKYCPQFPGRFGSIQDARSFCQQFFSWYNKEHRHSGIGLMTPEQVHYGLAQEVYKDRCQVLLERLRKNPQRFKGKQPKPHELPKAAWINKPRAKNETLI